MIKRDGTVVDFYSRVPFRTVKEATQSMSLMSDDTVTLTIQSADTIDFDKGDRIVVNGRTYTIRTRVERTIQQNGYYEYRPTFYGRIYDLMKTKYRGTDAYGRSVGLSFDLTYTLKQFLQVLINNTERDYPGLWVLDTENCPDTETKTISFSNQNCLAVLQNLCKTFETDFQITEADGVCTIHVGKFGSVVTPPNGADYFEWGRGRGLYSFKDSKVDDKAIITRLWVEGGTDNLPTGYRNYSERLQIPYPKRKNRYMHTLYDGTVIKPGDMDIGTDDDERRYIEDEALKEKYGTEEDGKQYDDDIPTHTGTVTSVGSDLYSFVDENMDFDLNAKNAQGTAYLINGTSAKITFNTGRLAGQQFDLHSYDHSTKTFTIKPYKDQRGLVIPTEDSEAYRIGEGDQFKITDIIMPDEVLAKAEEELWFDGYDDFLQASQPRAQYTVTFDRQFFLDNTDYNVDSCYFIPGDYLPIRDERFGVERSIRIQKVERNLLERHSYTVTVADTITINIVQQTVIDTINNTQVIQSSGIGNPIKMRRGWRTTQELLNMVFDTDGYFDGGNIKPLSIDTSLLNVGVKSQQFVLNGVVIEPNLNGNANLIHLTSGTLIHLTINESGVRTWKMTDMTGLLSSNSGHYVYARCGKTSSSGVWIVAQTQYTVEPDDDPNNYYFLVGVLGSIHDGWRDFTTMYGFTRINGNTITTGKIVSEDGNNYLDLDGNLFRIGDSASSVDYGVTKKGQITLHNVKVKSDSGDTADLGVYRGVYNSKYTYFGGDEVTYTSDGETVTYKHKQGKSTTGIVPTNTTYWDVSSKGKSGDTSFKSTVFCRNASKPSTPTGGSFTSPIPTSTNPSWSDGIPSGTDSIWASTRIFTMSGSGIQQDAWTEPRLMSDTDSFDVEFSNQETKPDDPSKAESGVWFDPSDDATSVDWTKMIWMATRTKTDGVWGSWVITKIKGEKGKPGDTGDFYEYRYAKNGSTITAPDIKVTDREPSGWDTAMPSVSAFEYVWMTVAKISGADGSLLESWSDPIRVNPYDGKDADRIYLRGTGYNNNADSIISINGEQHTFVTRGISAMAINRQTLAITQTKTFDTYSSGAAYGDATERTNLVSWLDSLDSTVFVALVSHEAVGWSSALQAKLQSFGLRYLSDKSTGRVPFAFLGYKGLPSGYALMMQTDTSADAAYAELSTYVADGQMIVSKDGKDGEDGKSPAMLYRGVYDSTKTYYGTATRVDCVKYNGHFYRTRVDAGGSFSNVLPTDSSKWNDFGADFESIATGLLLAEYANIAGWIFKNSMLISQKGTIDGDISEDVENDNFIPNIILDAVNGLIKAGNDIQIDQNGITLTDDNGETVAKIVNYPISNEIDTSKDSDSGTLNITDKGSYFYFYTANNYIKQTTQHYLSIGYLTDKSTLTLNTSKMSITLPTPTSGTITYQNPIYLKCSLICNGIEVWNKQTAISGTFSSGNTYSGELSVNKTFTAGTDIPEGNYQIRWQIICHALATVSGGSYNVPIILSNTYWAYKKASFNKTLIGNNGIFSCWGTHNYMLSSTSGFVVRYGDNLMRLGSSGLQKSTDGGSTWTSL